MVQQERTCWFLWQQRLHFGSPSHSRRHNKSLDIPTFQLQQFEVHLKPITRSTQEGKHPLKQTTPLVSNYLQWGSGTCSNRFTHETHTHTEPHRTHTHEYLCTCVPRRRQPQTLHHLRLAGWSYTAASAWHHCACACVRVWSTVDLLSLPCHSERKWCVYMWIIRSFGGGGRTPSSTADHSSASVQMVHFIQEIGFLFSSQLCSLY